MSNVVSLNVHKNTLEKRKRKEANKKLKECISDINHDKQMSYFVVVAWDEDRKISRVNWKLGDKDSIYQVPEAIKQILLHAFTDDK